MWSLTIAISLAMGGHLFSIAGQLTTTGRRRRLHLI
jgi:hypothetical protein